MQFSLKEFLVIAGVASVGVPALLYASTSYVVAAWTLLILAAFIISLIQALVGLGENRAAAIGRVAAAFVYLLYLGYHSDDSLDGRHEPIPTARVLAPLYQGLIAGRNYYEDTTGKRFDVPPPSAIPTTTALTDEYLASLNSSYPNQEFVYHYEPATEEDFLWVAHCLWTLLLGYLGGKYAVWVYTRRQPEETA